MVCGFAVGLLTVVIAVTVHEVAELLAVSNGVRSARRPTPVPEAT